MERALSIASMGYSEGRAVVSFRRVNKQAQRIARHMRKTLVHVAGCVYPIDAPGCWKVCGLIGSLYREVEEYENLCAPRVSVPRSLRAKFGRYVGTGS